MRINFSPLQIKFSRLDLAFGWLCLVVGMILVMSHYYNQGKLDATEEIIELIKEAKENEENV